MLFVLLRRRACVARRTVASRLGPARGGLGVMSAKMSMAGCANCAMQAQLIATQAQMIAMLQQQLAAATAGGGAAGPPVAVAMAVAEAPSPAALLVGAG